MIDTFKEMKNKGILSKQYIKRLKPIKSTDAKQAFVPTVRRKTKTQPSINKVSFLFYLLWTQVRPFSAREMRSVSFFLSSVFFLTSTQLLWKKSKEFEESGLRLFSKTRDVKNYFGEARVSSVGKRFYRRK